MSEMFGRKGKAGEREKRDKQKGKKERTRAQIDPAKTARVPVEADVRTPTRSVELRNTNSQQKKGKEGTLI